MNRDDAPQAERAHAALAGRRALRVRAFTLIELLVTIAIIAVLLSLLLPAIMSVVRITRSAKCQIGQRSVGFDFSIFADDTLHPYRGQNARSNIFQLTSFIDAQYQMGDFWAWGDVDEIELPDTDGHDPLRCPDVAGPITLSRGRQAFQGGVGPAHHLSFGFNIRLHQAEVINGSGQPSARRINIGSSVLSAANVPLMWDVNALDATERGLMPLLSGPSLGNQGVFGNDRYWFPAQRHQGNGNYLFIDGHVEESATPLTERWNWGYTPLAR